MPGTTNRSAASKAAATRARRAEAESDPPDLEAAAVVNGSRPPTGDHKAKKGKAADGIAVDFDGVTYTVDSTSVNDLELMEYLEEEKYVLAIRGYLGVEQWSKFKESHRSAETGRVPMDRVPAFLTELTEAIGQGNS